MYILVREEQLMDKRILNLVWVEKKKKRRRNEFGMVSISPCILLKVCDLEEEKKREEC